MDMNLKEGMIGHFTVEVGRGDLARRIGMNPAFSWRSVKLDGIISTVMAGARAIIRPAAIYRTFEIERLSSSRIFFRGTEFSIGSSQVASLLSGCCMASLVAATIGPEISMEIERLMNERKMTEAMILDAFGSEAAEATVDYVQRLMEESARGNGLGPSRRFSPGYGDWLLSAQKEILSELGAGRIGMSVNESFILFPEKSVTAVIGWRR